MQVDSPYSLVSRSKVEPGSLICIEKKGLSVLAFAVKLGYGHTAALVISGAEAGELVVDLPYFVLLLSERAIVRPTADVGYWSSKKRGGGVSFALDERHQYFVYHDDGKEIGANLASGDVDLLPARVMHSAGWEIVFPRGGGFDSIDLN